MTDPAYPSNRAASAAATIANAHDDATTAAANAAAPRSPRTYVSRKVDDDDEWSLDDGSYEYVGQRIARDFDGRVVLGRVTGYLAQMDGPMLWHASHDDGDSEDLEHDEVVAALRSYAEHAARESRRDQHLLFERSVSDPRRAPSPPPRVPALLGQPSKNAPEAAAVAWATTEPKHSARSRVLLLERLRCHTKHKVHTSFFFELPVDTDRYKDYVSKVRTPPICLRDIGDKLYRGHYADAAAADADFSRLFANCCDYNPEGSVVRDFGESLQKVVDFWLADYRACGELAIAKTKLSPDAREYHNLVAAGCGKCRHRGCGDCPLVADDLCVERKCKTCAKSLAVCAFLPTTGLSDKCVACAAKAPKQPQPPTNHLAKPPLATGPRDTHRRASASPDLVCEPRRTSSDDFDASTDHGDTHDAAVLQPPPLPTPLGSIPTVELSIVQEPHRHDVELSIVQEEASDESHLESNDAMSTSSADERDSTMSWTC